MNDEEKMYHIGWWILGTAVFLTVVLQVLYRSQNSARNYVRAEIVRVQQDTADAITKFEGLKRPEILRNLVGLVVPDATAIGFGKHISIDDLPERKDSKADD